MMFYTCQNLKKTFLLFDILKMKRHPILTLHYNNLILTLTICIKYTKIHHIVLLLMHTPLHFTCSEPFNESHTTFSSIYLFNSSTSKSANTRGFSFAYTRTKFNENRYTFFRRLSR